METERKILTMAYDAPCGSLTLGAVDGHLCLCDWRAEGAAECERRLRRLGTRARVEEGPSEATARAAEQLDRFFRGELRAFDLPLLLAGTAFQQRVWRELGRIPYGETVSYGELARRLGSPRAVRAVARAVGANLLSILLPCHRVIGAGRSLAGYRGGLPAKAWLLALEAREISRQTRGAIRVGK